MKRVEVLIPFRFSSDDADHVRGDILVVSDEELARIRAVNINMVSVIGEVTEQADPVKPKRATKPRKPKQ